MRVPRPPAPRCPFLSLLLLLPLVAAPWGQAVPCVSGGLPKPTNVTFLSINMKNVLQWNPPEGLQGVEVIYTVQYFIYGQKRWLNKSQCRNINRTYCDLSAETSDYEHQYYAKVKAIWETNCSKWAETGRFYPFLETQIGPPEVALTTDEKSMSIFLTPPEKWKRNLEDSSISMQQIYSNLKYNVSICNTRSNRMWSQCVSDRTLELTWLEPDTEYCVHVEAFVPGLPRPARPSEKQCVRTLKGKRRKTQPVRKGIYRNQKEGERCGRGFHKYTPRRNEWRQRQKGLSPAMIEQPGTLPPSLAAVGECCHPLGELPGRVLESTATRPPAL